MDGVILVDLLEGGDELILGDGLGQQETSDLHAQGVRALHRAPLIGQVVGFLAHADDAEHRGDARLLQLGALLAQALQHGLGHRCAF